jgi:hypothetical protein
MVLAMARHLACAVFLLFAAHASAQDAVWANTGLEKQGVTGQAFQDAGKADIAHCEAAASRAARRAIPISNPPPGFMEGWRSSSRDRERAAKECEFMLACMNEKGWALQQK